VGGEKEHPATLCPTGGELGLLHGGRWEREGRQSGPFARRKSLDLGDIRKRENRANPNVMPNNAVLQANTTVQKKKGNLLPWRGGEEIGGVTGM